MQFEANWTSFWTSQLQENDNMKTVLILKTFIHFYFHILIKEIWMYLTFIKLTKERITWMPA